MLRAQTSSFLRAPRQRGSCGAPLQLPTGQVLITETVPIGFQLTSVSASPADTLLRIDLQAGQATVTIEQGGQTVVTFQNAGTPLPPTGFLQICKVAGAGIVTGTNFIFSVAGTPVTVPAGPPPNGFCSAPLDRIRRACGNHGDSCYPAPY